MTSDITNTAKLLIEIHTIMNDACRHRSPDIRKRLTAAFFQLSDIVNAHPAPVPCSDPAARLRASVSAAHTAGFGLDRIAAIVAEVSREIQAKEPR